MSYLNGYVIRDRGQEMRPVPLRSFYVSTTREEVTFKFLPAAGANRKQLLQAWFKLLRLETAIFITGPIFLVLLTNLLDGYKIDWFFSILVGFGVLFFHFSLSLFNDYTDHLRGRDRIRTVGGSRAIQNGIISAYQVRNLALFFLFCSGLIALSVLVGAESLAQQGGLIVLGLALFFSIELLSPQGWLRGRGGMELISFFLAGPLLTGGFSWVTVHSINLDVLGLGCIFGSLVGLYVYLTRFAQMMHDQQAGYKTWPVRLGFERARRAGQFLVFVSVGWLLFDLVVLTHSWYLWPGFVTLLGFAFPLALRIGRVQSPLSSDIALLPNEALRLHWVTIGVLATGCVSILAMR